jgi:transposase
MVKLRRKSRLSLGLQRALLVQFVAGVPARTAADLVGVSRNTSILYFQKLRELIAAKLEEVSPFFSGEIEVDESYFGGYRKGKHGRGASGKVPVFGLLKRGGRVYTAMIQNTKRVTLMPIIRKKIVPDSVVYTDSYAVYNILDVSEFRHFRIDHSDAFVEQRHNHINGIENFWAQAKRHLRRYNGIPKANFYFFLKECEWRFNYRPTKNLLKSLTEWTKL